ncbi:DnaJ sub A member 3, mitochondrial [Thoreauomyces humboldtii]|nr:DnaJ sub A member 3, mitochondrial [Thoreauomyces humboldtii]
MCTLLRTTIQSPPLRPPSGLLCSVASPRRPKPACGQMREVSTTQHFCPYTALNVPRSATRADVKKAYYKMVFDLHPDRVPISPSSTTSPSPTSKSRRSPASPANTAEQERFLRVVRAYEILSDPKRRREWDASGSAAHDPTFSPGPSPFRAGAYQRHQSTYAWRGGPPPPAPGHTDETFYYHPGSPNSQPIYMSNGSFGILLICFATVSSTVVFMYVKSVRRKIKEQLDAQDVVLQEYYDERIKRAHENGVDKQIEIFKSRTTRHRRSTGPEVDLDSNLTPAR